MYFIYAETLTESIVLWLTLIIYKWCQTICETDAVELISYLDKSQSKLLIPPCTPIALNNFKARRGAPCLCVGELLTVRRW